MKIHYNQNPQHAYEKYMIFKRIYIYIDKIKNSRYSKPTISMQTHYIQTALYFTKILNIQNHYIAINKK